MANSDVKSKRLTGTGAASVGRSRLRQIQILTSSGGAGRLTLTDGNGGATVLDMDLDASDTHSVNIPANGIRVSDIHVSVLTNITAVTFFFN